MSAIAIAFGVLFVAIAGRDAVFVYLLPLPVALLLLWTSTSADRFDDHGIERLATPNRDIPEHSDVSV